MTGRDCIGVMQVLLYPLLGTNSQHALTRHLASGCWNTAFAPVGLIRYSMGKMDNDGLNRQRPTSGTGRQYSSKLPSHTNVRSSIRMFSLLC